MRPIEEIRLVRPATLADAALLLADDAARVVAGGTDLLPNMRRGIADPAVLIDLTAVAGIGAIEPHHGQWRLGAGVTLAAIERHARLAQERPALTQAAAAVAGPAHRSAATLGGNLCQDTRCVYYNQSAWWREANGWCLKLKGTTCHVAPQGNRCHAAYEGDVAAALLAYGAEVEIVGSSGSWRRPLAELYRDDGAAHLTLQPRELIAAVHVPAPKPGQRSGFRKVRTRGAMDFPLASVAVAMRLEGGVLAELAVGISGTNSHPLALAGTHTLLGRAVDEALLAALGKLVAKQVSPMRSTVTAANHRRLVAVNAAQRLLGELAAPSAQVPAAAG
jgi:4-hydroxybenzoyl-CoA reductase subunit beta